MEHPPYFYKQDVNTVTCYSYYDFVKTLAILQTKGTKIDPENTLRVQRFTFMFEDKTNQPYYAWYNLYPCLMEDFGIDIDVKRSYGGVALSSMYVLQLNMGVVVPEWKSPSTVILASALVIPEPVLTPDADPLEQEEEASDETLVDTPDVVVIDYTELNSLFNKDDIRSSKTALKAKVKSLYGIDLRKNQNFNEMIEQLREDTK